MKNKKQNATIATARFMKSQQPLLRDTGKILTLKTGLKAGKVKIDFC